LFIYTGNLVLNNPRHPGPNVVPPVNPAGPQAGQFVHLGVNYVRPQVGPQDGPQAVPPKGPQVVPPAGGQNIESGIIFFLYIKRLYPSVSLDNRNVYMNYQHYEVISFFFLTNKDSLLNYQFVLKILEGSCGHM
jgi:hypothetical protein